MNFDHAIGQRPAQYADINGADSGQGRIELVNAWLDSTHGRSKEQPPPPPEKVEAPKDQMVGVIEGGVARGFTQQDDWALRDMFYSDFHAKWWLGEPVADKINKRLEDAHSQYRTRFEGPFKTDTVPPYGRDVYEYRLTVTDLQGKSLQQLPMTFIKESEEKK